MNDELGKAAVDALARVLKASRERAGVTQAAMARRAGVHRSEIWKLENQHFTRVPDRLLTYLAAYATAEGVSPAKLMRQWTREIPPAEFHAALRQAPEEAP